MSDQLGFPGFDEPGRAARPVRARRPTVALPNVFFALRPAEADLPRVEATALGVRKRHGTSSGPVPADRLHVTCAELRRQSDEPAEAVIERAMAVASGLVVSPFDISFTRVVRFRAGDKRPLVLLEQGEGTALKRFITQLERALNGAEVAHRMSRNPHMTLGYGGGDVDEALPVPVRWTAQELVLIRSLWGRGKHECLRRWPWLPRG